MPKSPNPALTDDRDLDDLLDFVAEDVAEDYLKKSLSKQSSGTFVALSGRLNDSRGPMEADWELDLSATAISGEGIDERDLPKKVEVSDRSFLETRGRGKKSSRAAVLRRNTRVSIEPEICKEWVSQILSKGWFSSKDLEDLVCHCRGNCDREELMTNIIRTLEVAGLQLVDDHCDFSAKLWGSYAVHSDATLVEAIEACLSRKTRLPGSGRFFMDKSIELPMLNSMKKANQELQLALLECGPAISSILDVLKGVVGGVVDSSFVIEKTIYPQNEEHEDTIEFVRAVRDLENWFNDGCALDGKRRRIAVEAMSTIGLSIEFQKKICRALSKSKSPSSEIDRIYRQLDNFDEAVSHIIEAFLPYVRRFSSRRVIEGEDPDDVFQVAFLGFLRATRLFDPDQGYRLVTYSTYWMRQAITRWRADEGSIVRIPVHRQETLAEFDRTKNGVIIGDDGSARFYELTLEEISETLAWGLELTRGLARIPRVPEYPDGFDDWDKVLDLPFEERVSTSKPDDPLHHKEARAIISEVLTELMPRSAEVIRMRFGIGGDEEMTLEEIGQIYGVTRERIRQIEAKALQSLKHPVRKQRLEALME